MSTKRKSPPSGAGKRQHQIRMDDVFRGRIRKYQEKLVKATGMDVTLSDAMRSLIEKSLQAESL
jgi:hypothetical protein